MQAQDNFESCQALPSDLLRRIPSIQAGLSSGEIHVSPNRVALYWMLPDQTAIRFAYGAGRPGLCKPDAFYVPARQEWPSWTPAPAMIDSEPEHDA